MRPESLHGLDYVTRGFSHDAWNGLGAKSDPPHPSEFTITYIHCVYVPHYTFYRGAVRQSERVHGLDGERLTHAFGKKEGEGEGEFPQHSPISKVKFTNTRAFL